MADFEDANGDHGSDHSSDHSDEDGPTLSAATLLALRDFALNQGVAIEDDRDIVETVQKHFDLHDRNEEFSISFSDATKDVHFKVKGVKRELGQTLSSTGLTIWRAAEHLCEYVFKNSEFFSSKSICELGAGLGMVSILIDKVTDPAYIIVTDGDEDTMELLSRNIVATQSRVSCEKLWWGKHHEFAGRNSSGFDIIIAADVIYEVEQVKPLIATVCSILKRDGDFILAFARRNVSIDVVFREAEKSGLCWHILDEDTETHEHIYIFQWS